MNGGEREGFCLLSMASLLKFSHLSNRKTKARVSCCLWILVVMQKCKERIDKNVRCKLLKGTCFRGAGVTCF